MASALFGLHFPLSLSSMPRCPCLLFGVIYTWRPCVIAACDPMLSPIWGFQVSMAISKVKEVQEHLESLAAVDKDPELEETDAEDLE